VFELESEKPVIVQAVEGPKAMGLRQLVQLAKRLIEIKLVGFKAAMELITEEQQAQLMVE
jgi:hypothetical protein